MVAGLLASGISVNGLQPSHNPQVASQMFKTATTVDPAMCDAWLARILAGEQSIDVLAGAWNSVRTFGWETRRLGVTDLQFRPDVSDGLFLKLAVTSVESLACAYAAVLAEAKRYQEAAKLLDDVEPRHPFDTELVNYVRGVLYFRTERWPDVLVQFPEGTQWRHAELKAAIDALASGAFSGGDRDAFEPVISSILNRDEYLVLADYRSYIDCHDRAVRRAWTDEDQWTRMSILNTARSGYFSSDRTVRDYCRDIWHAEPVPVSPYVPADPESLARKAT